MEEQMKEVQNMEGKLTAEATPEVATNEETDESPTTSTPATNGTAPKAAEESQYNGIMVTATPEFKAAVKAAAEKADKSLSAWVRDLIATTIGYTGPMSKETKRVRKYASEEERAAAQKSRNKQRRDVIKALLEKYGDEFKAQLDGEDEDEDEE